MLNKLYKYRSRQKKFAMAQILTSCWPIRGLYSTLRLLRMKLQIAHSMPQKISHRCDECTPAYAAGIPGQHIAVRYLFLHHVRAMTCILSYTRLTYRNTHAPHYSGSSKKKTGVSVKKKKWKIRARGTSKVPISQVK